MSIAPIDRRYIDTLRGASILRVMLAHLGLSWFFLPYSQYISIILPVFFFVSGAVSFNSVLNSKNKPFYFINRYIALIVPFLIFSLPFLLLLLLNGNTFTGYDVIQWLLAWPSRESYPFDMRQIWFINALILMFFISYPIFKLSRKSLIPLTIAFLISLIYIPIAEQQGLISAWRELDILIQLDSPMQVHQVFALINYYFFGALFYQVTILKKSHLIALCLFSLAVALLLHLQIESFNNMKVFFFERTTYFTALSYTLIFILLIFRDNMIQWLDRMPRLDRVCLSLSKNSYALFLIHTPIIFVFEKYLALDNLGSQPILALVKMVGVITVSLLLAPYFTAVSTKIIKRLKLQKTPNKNQEKISNVD